MERKGALTNLQFRRATEDDLDRLVEIHVAGYPDPRSVAARQRNFTRSPFGGLDDLIVVEDRGAIVAHAFLFRFRASFGDAIVKMGGVASVAVAPEARGRGIATATMSHLHALASRRGDAITMLYAFRQGFYARLGYAATPSRKRLAIDTRSIPDAWRALGRERVRGPRGDDLRSMQRLYAAAAARTSGRTTRTRHFWESLVTRESRLMLICERTLGASRARPVAGYVAFSFAQEQPHAETVIEVEELIAEDDESRRALLGALGSMRDQVSEIVLESALDDPLEHALLDSDAKRFGNGGVEHGLGEIVGGPMVRICDVARALSARGYVGSGAFGVVVTDDFVAFDVRVRNGRATVSPRLAGGRSRALQTTRAGLSAIFYGGLSATNAVALGLAEADAGVLRTIDAVAKLPPFMAIDAF
jgi:predicted acetyltransferase